MWLFFNLERAAFTALREAVLNAVIHKDYASDIPIQIRVFADKLIIWNPGELPLDWTIDRA
jgi:ATP-dependent DNA helicase RecG